MASQDAQPFHWHYGELHDKNFQLHGRSLFVIVILFALLLLFALLCVYARWVCRYRQSSSTATPNPTATMVRSTGLDPATIDGLPICLHRSSSATTTTTTTTTTEELQCSICLCIFKDEEKVKVLPDCHHVFHPGCVDQWLVTQSSCPLCRASLRVDSAIYEE